MAGLTDEQRMRAGAWETVFADAGAAQVVLDDMTAFANALPESQMPGACRLLLYILAKRSQARRARHRAKGALKP